MELIDITPEDSIVPIYLEVFTEEEQAVIDADMLATQEQQEQHKANFIISNLADFLLFFPKQQSSYERKRIAYSVQILLSLLKTFPNEKWLYMIVTIFCFLCATLHLLVV